jgi:hypothetical protein
LDHHRSIPDSVYPKSAAARACEFTHFDLSRQSAQAEAGGTAEDQDSAAAASAAASDPG